MKLTFRYILPEDVMFIQNSLLNDPKAKVYLGMHGFDSENLESRHHKICLVALADGKVAGFVVVAARDYTEFNYIGELYVIKEYRRQGIGTALVKEAQKYAYINWLAKGIDVLTYENDPMERILKKDEFKFSGHYKKRKFHNGKFYGQNRWFKIYK